MPKKLMQVILIQNVESLGLKGEVIEVAPGYVRNFLLPKKLAEIATPQAIKKAQAQKATQSKKEEEERKKALEIAKKLEGLAITIPAKVGEEGKLFGSITSDEIVKALRNQAKIKIDKKAVLLDEPIRKVGKYNIKVKLFKDLKATLKIKIKKRHVRIQTKSN